MNHIGERIRELRTLSGMSQDALGQRIGVQRAAINKYEKGTVENVPIKTIEKMAAVFDVSPTYLTGWNEQYQNPLAVEVKILQGVKHFYGESTVELIEDFLALNSTGRKKVLQYCADIAKVYSNR